LCFQFLVNEFCDVDRHVFINKWDIDFYIKSIDTYVQLDGVYWHGLDRPIDVITLFLHPRDKTIYNTLLRDKEQNKWFEQNDKRLIRFTDKEIKQWQKEKKLTEQIKFRLLKT
jgi:hypothetical protein